MPSLPTATFAGLHADAEYPVPICDGVWGLKAPTSPEAVVASTTTLINMHFNLTIPSGYTYMIIPYGNDDVAGAPGCVVRSGGWVGTGSARTIYINYMNLGGSNQTPTAGSYLAYLYIYKEDFEMSL